MPLLQFKHSLRLQFKVKVAVNSEKLIFCHNCFMYYCFNPVLTQLFQHVCQFENFHNWYKHNYDDHNSQLLQFVQINNLNKHNHNYHNISGYASLSNCV